MMNSSPDDFKDLRRLLALKRHEQPPPGYFGYLPDKVMMRIERDDLSEHSTWWEWLVRKLDAQPVLAGAYAFAISGLMLLGFKLSQDLQHESNAEGIFSTALDPNAVQPSPAIQKHFANPAPLFYLTDFSSTEPVLQEPPPAATFKTFQTRSNFAPVGH